MTADCINYTGKEYDGDGYPTLNGERVDKVLLQMRGLSVGSNQYVVHLCGNKLCINPAHIVVDESPDRLSGILQVPDGRSIGHLGENNPNTKLTQKDVELIDLLLDAGVSQGELARRFDVRQQTISSIAVGRTWSEVTGRPK